MAPSAQCVCANSKSEVAELIDPLKEANGAMLQLLENVLESLPGLRPFQTPPGSQAYYGRISEVHTLPLSL